MTGLTEKDLKFFLRSILSFLSHGVEECSLLEQRLSCGQVHWGSKECSDHLEKGSTISYQGQPAGCDKGAFFVDARDSASCSVRLRQRPLD